MTEELKIIIKYHICTLHMYPIPIIFFILYHHHCSSLDSDSNAKAIKSPSYPCHIALVIIFIIDGAIIIIINTIIIIITINNTIITILC